ncbi:cytoplasmic trna 2-thiolation protein 2 [Quercus suber]|uniref:Cytoplasmic trna 2-thiolation protein 2 n=1 Tax=Quercus suber TaxID=58331 RepID=A0AAW0IPU7_QUESU
MACNPSNCQSNCYGNEEKAEVVVGEEYVSTNQNQNLCIKCKTKEPIGGDEGRMFCIECFRSNLYGKFRLAVTSHAMITPTDNFVHELQHKSLKNFDASRDRSLPVFGVGVAFIDETTISPLPSHDIDRAIQDIRLIVSNLAPPIKQLHVVPIENIYSGDGTNRLKNLLDAVSDTTGKEDLLLHLRMLSLQKVASVSGYNKIVLGLCTSRIACHVISATVKGQGYSLPADIQYVDSRWEIPIVLPLRDCLEENPSRECTIVRTAGKLTPFHFNRIPESDDSVIPLATRRRQKRYNLKPNESISSESFCPICNSPLNKSDMLRLSNLGSCQTSSDSFGAACCSSCRFQILPKGPSSMDHFYSLLPQPLVARAKHSSYDNLSLHREQIQDCLLSDSEDES